MGILGLGMCLPHTEEPGSINENLMAGPVSMVRSNENMIHIPLRLRGKTVVTIGDISDYTSREFFSQKVPFVR